MAALDITLRSEHLAATSLYLIKLVPNSIQPADTGFAVSMLLDQPATTARSLTGGQG